MYVHPSTELFDHGIDSIVTSLSGISTVALLGLGSSPLWAAMHACCVWSLFYLPTYQHLVTGRMAFSAGLDNPTEGLVGTMLLLLIQGAYPLFLSTSLQSVVPEVLLVYGNDIAPSISSLLGGIDVVTVLLSTPLKHWLVIGEVCNVVSTVVASLHTTLTTPAALRPGLGSWNALVALAPLLLTWVVSIGCAFIMMPLSLFFNHESDHLRVVVLPTSPIAASVSGGPACLRTFLLLLAASNNLATLWLIVCEMTKTRFPWASLLLSNSVILSAGTAYFIAFVNSANLNALDHFVATGALLHAPEKGHYSIALAIACFVAISRCVAAPL